MAYKLGDVDDMTIGDISSLSPIFYTLAFEVTRPGRLHLTQFDPI